MSDLAFGKESFKACKLLSLDGMADASLSSTGISSLRSIAFGEDSFAEMAQLTLHDFKTLTTLTFDVNSFSSLVQLDLSTLPNLETITAQNRTCYHLKTLELKGGPSPRE